MCENHAIRQLQQGNINGLEWLVQNYQLLAFQVGYLILQDEQQTENIVQEAFLNVYKNINKYDPSHAFKPWFTRIVMNLAVTVLRKERKYHYYSDEITLDSILAATYDSPEIQIEISEFQNAVWEAMKVLSPNQRKAVVMHYFLDMNGFEIASEIGYAPGTVKWLLSTARKKLRLFLSEKGINHET